MAITTTYLKSGSGRCPYPSTKTEYITYTTAELKKIRDLYEGHSELTKALIEELVSRTAGKLISKIRMNDTFKDVANDQITGYVMNHVRTNVDEIDTIMQNNMNSSSVKVKCNIGCINKGQNGHYWVIRSMKEA